MLLKTGSMTGSIVNHLIQHTTTTIRKIIQFLVFVVQPQLNSTTSSSPIYINVIKNYNFLKIEPVISTFESLFLLLFFYIINNSFISSFSIYINNCNSRL